jgi:hypothetical protein
MFKGRWPFSVVQDTVSSAGFSDVTLDSDDPTAIKTHVILPTKPKLQEPISLEPKPQRGVKRKDPLDKIVDIVVGDGDNVKYFEHHRRILSKESQHFRAAFKKEWEIPLFSFPNEDPDIYARVAHWMYFKEFIFDEEKNQDSEAELDSTQVSEDLEDLEAEDKDLRLAELPPDGGNLKKDASRELASPKSAVNIVDLEGGLDDSDYEKNSQTLANSQAQASPPTPLDTLTLSKIWALAKRLGIPKLCNEIITLLGKRLGYDMKTPGHALVYAFQRCRPDSPLRRLLVDFTARSAPIKDLLEDAAFDATDFSPELWCALVGGLVNVRSEQYIRQAEWMQNFEATVSVYHLKETSLPLRSRIPAYV